MIFGPSGLRPSSLLSCSLRCLTCIPWEPCFSCQSPATSRRLWRTKTSGAKIFTGNFLFSYPNSRYYWCVDISTIPPWIRHGYEIKTSFVNGTVNQNLYNLAELNLLRVQTILWLTQIYCDLNCHVYHLQQPWCCLFSFVKSALTKNAKKRPPAERLLYHPFVLAGDLSVRQSVDLLNKVRNPESTTRYWQLQKLSCHRHQSAWEISFQPQSKALRIWALTTLKVSVTRWLYYFSIFGLLQQW